MSYAASDILPIEALVKGDRGSVLLHRFINLFLKTAA
jgi:hypothetical protein